MTDLRLTLVATALLLAGCSMTPDYEVPQVAVGSVYLNASRAAGISEAKPEPGRLWWQQFNDPQLDRLVMVAQQQNIPIRMASERIKAAQSYQAAVSSLKVPTIALNAGYVDMRLSENGPLSGPAVAEFTLPPQLGGSSLSVLDRDNQTHLASATIGWEADLFGRIDALSQAASIRVEQAELLQRNLTTLMTAEVINNYLQYRAAGERVAITRQIIAEQQQVLTLVQSLHRHGYGSELDLANARAAQATTEAMLPMLDSARAAHLGRLAILLGETTTQTRNRLGEGALPQMSGLIPVGLPSELLNRRFDIALAEREMAARNQQLGAAIANRYPKLVLTGTPGVSASDLDDLISSGSVGWSLGAGISWNLFDGGRGAAMVDLQQAGFRESALAYQQVVNGAFNEVDTVLRAYANSQQYQQLIARADDQAQIAVNKATSLYQAGLENHLSVLNAQRVSNNLQDARVQVRLNSATTVVLLHKALGGEWRVPQDAPQEDEALTEEAT
ncbi:efflux transporter outer membrane subunit [Aeromonas allosaccharophila]|uniref:efflux transporter outer membrane subunit n=1 Tax=Aeromonas allosaccharophila TaxID=656 RepID=UPI0005AA4522|nr:efflux transporter outer membrane subunit [Aeromonas allosaccharophila]